MCLINVSYFLKLIIIIIIGCAGSLPCTGFLVVVNGGFSLWWLFLLWSTGFRCMGSVVAAYMFSSHGSWALRHGLSSQHIGSVVLWHVGSSQTRDRTHVTCNGRWILYHRATRKALFISNNAFFLFMNVCIFHANSGWENTLEIIWLCNAFCLTVLPISY